MSLNNSNTCLHFNDNRIEFLKMVNDSLGLSDTTIQNIIFVYTPPKVGSTTLVSSIRLSAAFKFRVLHLHDEEMLYVLTKIKDVTIDEIIKYNKYIGRNVYVIDVYREPLERKMSEFFDKLSSFHFNNTAEKINKYNVNRLISRFNNIFPHIANGDHYFDKMTDVIKPVKFDFEKKHLIQKVFDITYIKLRLRDSAQWGKILSGILGVEIIIVNDYETSNGPLKELYQRFKNEYKIPTNYISQIEICPYFKYYLSPSEQSAYILILKTKSIEEMIGYSSNEYKMYVNICIENQWNTTIDTEHYLDEGCICRACNRQRRILFSKARRGERIKEKITHANAIQKWTIINTNSVVHEPKPPINSIPSSTRKRKKESNSNYQFKNNLMNNILETRINPW